MPYWGWHIRDGILGMAYWGCHIGMPYKGWHIGDGILGMAYIKAVKPSTSTRPAFREHFPCISLAPDRHIGDAILGMPYGNIGDAILGVVYWGWHIGHGIWGRPYLDAI